MPIETTQGSSNLTFPFAHIPKDIPHPHFFIYFFSIRDTHTNKKKKGMLLLCSRFLVSWGKNKNFQEISEEIFIDNNPSK